MDPRIAADLSQEKPSPFHEQMLNDCRTLVNISRRKMTEYYASWDRNDDIYRSIKKRDAEDVAAVERKEPEKMVVPISFAQIQTFVAFCYSLYMQRDRFFELEGFTPEDDRPAKVGEALLARDLSKNCFEALLYQFLLDIGRFGIGIMKTTWVTEYQDVRKTVTTPAKTFLGMQYAPASTQEVIERGVAYEGNRIINISPYRFFPDVRLPLVRFQEGEFCASEDIYTFSQLKQWESDGMVAGVDFVKPLTKDIAQDRGYRWDSSSLEPNVSLVQGAGLRGDGQTKKPAIVTELQRTLIPTQYLVNDLPLGPEDYPVKYVIWMANDNRIIKCEPMNYLHNQYTYTVAPFLFDNNVLISQGLADVIDQLQSVISWFLNARITNVRKVIGDKLIVNPSMVNMTDLTNRRPVIRLSAAATGEIDKHIKQLQLTDVTAHHVSDVKDLHDILKVVTGITDSLLGEVRPGKRSATENRNTTSGAASRLRTLAQVIFRFALEPMGRQMLSNLRDGLDNETFVKVLGARLSADPANQAFVPVDKSALTGHYDFEVFDGTLPTERMYSAQAIEELVQVGIQNPQALLGMGLDLKKLLYESLTLRGIHNPERFELAQPQLQNALAQQQAAAAASEPPQPQPGPGGAVQNGPGTPPPTGPTGMPPITGGPVQQPGLSVPPVGPGA